MLRNYLISAFRNLIRNKGFALINIFGLATGLAICILITIYVGHEWSYDRFHKNKDRIYRLCTSTVRPESTEKTPITSPAMGADIMSRFPEVEGIARFCSIDCNLKYKEKSVTSGLVLSGDSSLFKIFSFSLIEGDPRHVLNKPNSIVLSKTIANQLFDKESPIGKVIDWNNGSDMLTVTGIVEDVPKNSSIQYRAFISFQTLYHMNTGTLTEWDGNFSFATYLLVNHNCNVEVLGNRINQLADEVINPKLSRFNVKLELFLQPLSKIHLYSNLQYEKPGAAKSLFLFSSIALFILFIAGFNFVNLSTAMGSKRSKEIGVRLVSGSTKNRIRIQHIGETIIICTISCLFSLLIVELIMPYYNNLLGLRLSLYHPDLWWIQIAIPIFTILFSILAGLYPAFYLTSFNPTNILKSNLGLKKGKSAVRNILVSLQFIISTILIIFTIAIFLQVRYMTNRDIGLDTNNLAVFSLNGNNSWKRAAVLKSEISKLPEVESTSYATDVAGNTFTQNGYKVEGIADPVMIRALGVSYDYIDNMKISLIEGRNFSPTFPTDSEAVIINETLAKKVGWQTSVGKEITREKKFKVIGVIKDFHFRSMRHQVEPLIIFLPFADIKYYWTPMLHVRLREGTSQLALSKIEEIWKKFEGDNPIDYVFIGEIFKSHYRSEINFGRLFIYFSLIAILISCLGLLGLASFNMKTRIKEVSIRKVMGSSTFSIIKHLSIDFTKYAILSNVFAWPIAWIIITKWLNDFPYRISTPWWVFIATGVLLFTLSILTVIYQTYKTARINPAETLKYE